MQADFERLVTRHRRQVDRLVDRYREGAISTEEFGDRMNAVLFRGHSDAVTLGRRLAGVRGRQTDDDQLLGLDNADRHGEFLSNFLADLDSGRYTLEDGTLNVGSVKRRADMYVQQLRSTANESFVENSPPEVTFDWILGANDHCSECPMMAAASPLTANELFIVPGQATCLHNCTCRLVRSDGVEGFKRV